MPNLLSQSCHIAFSALTEELKRFARLAKVELPQFKTPFDHHPSTNIDLILQTANQMASGFHQTENNTSPTLATLFEQIRLAETATPKTLNYRYPIAPLSAVNLFPVSQAQAVKSEDDIALELSNQGQDFFDALKAIPISHQQQASLWLDHFDTAYQCFFGNVASQVGEISLYDKAKTTAALATALWRYQQANGNQAISVQSKEEAFLLIQGDFFGIQDFIFSGGSETNKQAAKLLRGRSFQVSLFCELAALKLLQACALPSTSQILNAAGKFLIVAPNTAEIRTAVQQVQAELNTWFIQHTYGLIGLGIATEKARCQDFIGEAFPRLQTRLFRQLERKKLQRLDLTDSTQSVQNDVDYRFGVCKLNQHFPAESEQMPYSLISQDQITIGHLLAKKDRLIVCERKSGIVANHKTEKLRLPIFGFEICFTEEREDTGEFSRLVQENRIYRFWDFSLPENTQQRIWNGYARRYINAYIPHFDKSERLSAEKYPNVESLDVQKGEIETFDYLACEDRTPLNNGKCQDNGKYQGQTALMTLKGDVDNLGSIFQKGLKNASFAKIAALSRQMNQFFSLWLPAYCNETQAKVYTVFAGGDDFFLIGSWQKTQKLANEMRQAFQRYVANNPQIHFSVGMVMTKVGTPVPRLGELAETALEKAKAVDGKNAVTIYDRSVPWAKWQSLQALGEEIERLAKDYQISTAYLYALIRFAEQAEKEDKEKHIDSAIWRSRFYYKTARFIIDKLPEEQKESALNEIINSLGKEGIDAHKLDLIIPLFNYFYQQR